MTAGNGYGDKGQFCWLSKHLLRVDVSYQRGIRKEKVGKIASNWDWRKCGTLTISRRGERDYYIVDGQHRRMAADTLEDVNELPCMVFRMADIPEEAVNFVSGQKDRANLTAFDQFRAKLVAGDPVALRVNKMLYSTGYVAVPSNKATGQSEFRVSCIDRLQEEFHKDLRAGDTPVLEDGLWQLMVRICDNRAPHNRLVLGLCSLQRAMRKEGQSLTHASNQAKLIKAGADGIFQAMASATKFLEDKSSKTLAIGILNVLNKGRRTGRISLNGFTL